MLKLKHLSLRPYPERKFNFSTFYCLKAVRNSISPVDTTTHLQIKKLGLARGKLSTTHRNKYKSKWTMTTVSGMEALELTVAGRQSKIWTSKLRHIGIKSSSGSADLHKTKTICQQLIQIPLPAPTSLLLPSSRIYFRSAEQNPKTNPVVKILALLHFRIYFDPIVYEYLNTFLRIRWRTILIFTKLCL